jgi:hypothetical protein
MLQWCREGGEEKEAEEKGLYLMILLFNRVVDA